MEMNFEAVKKEIIESFGESKAMVLSTCSGNRVTSRAMSCIFKGIDILFQMSLESTKAQQILENSHVALCVGNIQVEGKASIIGHPYEVPYFKEHYSKLHPGSYKAYSGLPSNRVVEVSPSLITLWKYDSEGNPYLVTLDLANGKAYQKSHPTCQA